MKYMKSSSTTGERSTGRDSLPVKCRLIGAYIGSVSDLTMPTRGLRGSALTQLMMTDRKISTWIMFKTTIITLINAWKTPDITIS